MIRVLYYDIVKVLNNHISEKLTIQRIIFYIRNEGGIQDGTTGIAVNDINVSKKLRKMWLRNLICRETNKQDNHTLLYWVDKEIPTEWVHD